MATTNNSWVPGADGSGFGLNHLPYGTIDCGDELPRPAVRIGDQTLELHPLVEAGLFDGEDLPPEVFAGPTLNPFLSLGRATWSAVRGRLTELLRHGNSEIEDTGLIEEVLRPLSQVGSELPLSIGNFVDFYSSLNHATNVGHIFRPDAEPLLPNWRHLPVAYNGRASSVVPSGTQVRRPTGQLPPAEPGGIPFFGPTEALDIELELAFITGPGNELGTRIPTTAAREHIFGVTLVNDWSARDIQFWEYQPLGPLLSKSFATSVSPWITPLEALEPFRVNGPTQVPTPHEYLQCDEPWTFDIDLKVSLIPAGRHEETVIAATNFSTHYWNMAQQLAHLTVNGANVIPGDLYASGTISGSEEGSYGSLLELTLAGREPLMLPGGEERRYLEDGDTVILHGGCNSNDGESIQLGEVAGTISPAI
jgi:fumarylacetoacetase